MQNARRALLDAESDRESGKSHTRGGAGQRAAAGLSIVAVAAPQLLGGVVDGAALAIYVIAAAACCWTASQLHSSRDLDVPVPLFAAGALAATLWTWAQALPLPCFLVRWAQPERLAMLNNLLELEAIERERCAISAAPGSTWIAGGTAAMLVGLAVSATATARSGGRSMLLRAIALSSVAMACVALAHWVTGETKVFGFYEPVYVKPRLLVAPLLNENHLAGHLALGWPLCLSLALSARHVDAKVAWLVAALLVFTTGLLSLSRAGAAALLLGGAAFAVTRFVGRSKAAKRRSRFLLIALSMISLVGGYFAYDKIVDEFAPNHIDGSKLKLIEQLFPIFLDHPIAGIGRGALRDVSVHSLSENVRAYYTENLPTHWLIEWGLPCTLLLSLTVLLSWRAFRPTRMRGDEVALACGLGALVAQNLLDFSLELPGVAATAAIALGVLGGRERTVESSRLPSLRRSLIPISACAVAGSVLALPWLTWWSRDALRAGIQRTMDDRTGRAEELLGRAFRHYPMDPEFVLLGAATAVHRSSPRTGRWLNLAMEIAPGWAAPHRLAAIVLERRGALKQAAIELSLATTRDDGQSTAAACELIRRHPLPDLAWSAADETPRRRKASLESLMGCFPNWTSRESEIFTEMLLREYGGSRIAHQRFVSIAAYRGDLELALTRAQQALRALPGDAEAVAGVADILVRQNRAAEALALLRSQPAPVRASASVMGVELQALSTLGLDDLFEVLLGQMLAEHGRTIEQRAAVHRMASTALASRAKHRSALVHAQASYDLTRATSDLETVHQLAVRVGALGIALRAASELCQVGHRPEMYCRKTAAPLGP